MNLYIWRYLLDILHLCQSNIVVERRWWSCPRWLSYLYPLRQPVSRVTSVSSRLMLMRAFVSPVRDDGSLSLSLSLSTLSPSVLRSSKDTEITGKGSQPISSRCFKACKQSQSTRDEWKINFLFLMAACAYLSSAISFVNPASCRLKHRGYILTQTLARTMVTAPAQKKKWI